MTESHILDAALLDVAIAQGSTEDPISSSRRQQVYDAQKRHRQRKNDYVRELEAEIARLRAMDAVTNLERDTLLKQNMYLQGLLPTSAQTTTNAAAWAGSTIHVQHDQSINRERIFIEPLSNASAIGGASTVSTGSDSWAALDFILALDWPCRYHVAHPITNAKGEVLPCGGDFGGHSMTHTAAVLAASRLHSVQGINSEILEKWQLPPVEIENQALELDDLITPAQAYAEIKARVGQGTRLVPILDELKVRLADVLHCEGLGAVIPIQAFDQHLQEVLQQQPYLAVQ